MTDKNTPRLDSGIRADKTATFNAYRCDDCGEVYSRTKVPVLVRTVHNGYADDWERRSLAPCTECGGTAYQPLHEVYDSVAEGVEGIADD